jgi:hypothetical protein
VQAALLAAGQVASAGPGHGAGADLTAVQSHGSQQLPSGAGPHTPSGSEYHMFM